MRIRLALVMILMFQLCSFAQAPRVAGAVYTSTNSTAGNAVVVMNRQTDGTLAAPVYFPTGGFGTGNGLANQGGVTLSDDERWLLVVNAGSDEISVFSVNHFGVRLMDIKPSGGDRPVSVAMNRNLVYVLNAGDANNITGFRLSDRGILTAIPGSTRNLSGLNVGAAQVSFNTDGDSLVVTERVSNMLDVYSVDSQGVAQGPSVYPSSGVTPFGFAFGKRDQVFVSEAFGGAPDSSAASSYLLSAGVLSVIDGSVPTTETSACWVVVSNDGRFAYTANAASASISGFRVSFDGQLELLNADGRTATVTGGNPTDMAISQNGRFLYVLQGGGGRVAAFAAGSDGSLQPVTGAMDLPTGLNGLAAR
jgi:6-phosphogluconolactonase